MLHKFIKNNVMLLIHTITNSESEGCKMVQNVIMLGTGVYVPPNKVYNDYFVQHFHEMGLESEGLMEHLGRRKRYLANPDESSLSMGYKAAQNALEKLHMDPEELDMIVFVSDTPEYTFPTNALRLNKLLGAKNAHTVFDMNCNCIGMLTALDLVTRYVQSKTRIKKILVVGSLHISAIANKNDTMIYPNFADSAAAVILENLEEVEKRGFLDSTVFTDPSFEDTFLMPACGNSKMFSDNIPVENKRLQFTTFDFSFLSVNWTAIINRLLERNNAKAEEINHFIFSQFSDPANMETLKNLGVGEDKYTFVGKEYGYTGVTSPIVALNRTWKRLAEPGKQVVFCSVAAGYSMTSLLYKF